MELTRQLLDARVVDSVVSLMIQTHSICPLWHTGLHFWLQESAAQAHASPTSTATSTIITHRCLYASSGREDLAIIGQLLWSCEKPSSAPGLQSKQCQGGFPSQTALIRRLTPALFGRGVAREAGAMPSKLPAQRSRCALAACKPRSTRRALSVLDKLYSND